MSITSNSRRNRRRKREASLRNKIRWLGARTRICNIPGCKKKSWQWKRCKDHRFYYSVASTLSKLTKDGKIERVKRGWYKAISGKT